jgi:uncharacterized protein
VQRFFDLLLHKDIETWAGLWTESARIIVFYPPEGSGPSIEGRAAIRSAFLDFFQHFEKFEPELTAIYAAAESDTVIVEYRNRALLVGGIEYTNSNIAVFRFDGDLISAYHDYFDPLRFQVVIDTLRKR